MGPFLVLKPKNEKTSYIKCRRCPYTQRFVNTFSAESVTTCLPAHNAGTNNAGIVKWRKERDSNPRTPQGA